MFKLADLFILENTEDIRWAYKILKVGGWEGRMATNVRQSYNSSKQVHDELSSLMEQVFYLFSMALNF